jgi:hypothetical protein
MPQPVSRVHGECDITALARYGFTRRNTPPEAWLLRASMLSFYRCKSHTVFPSCGRNLHYDAIGSREVFVTMTGMAHATTWLSVMGDRTAARDGTPAFGQNLCSGPLMSRLASITRLVIGTTLLIGFGLPVAAMGTPAQKSDMAAASLADEMPAGPWFWDYRPLRAWHCHGSGACNWPAAFRRIMRSPPSRGFGTDIVTPWGVGPHHYRYALRQSWAERVLSRPSADLLAQGGR